MRIRLPFILSVLALSMGAGLCACSTDGKVGVATRGITEAANQVGPILKEIRQKPSGEIALVYVDQPFSGAGDFRNFRSGYLHVYELDMKQLWLAIEQAPATSTIIPASVSADTSHATPLFEVNPQKISGNWQPDYEELGVDPFDAPAQFASWYASDVTVISPTQPVTLQTQWNSCRVQFLGGNWIKSRPGYLLFLPVALVFDAVTLPLQIEDAKRYTHSPCDCPP